MPFSLILAHLHECRIQIYVYNVRTAFVCAYIHAYILDHVADAI
jgi:hypothetical protein